MDNWHDYEGGMGEPFCFSPREEESLTELLTPLGATNLIAELQYLIEVELQEREYFKAHSKDTIKANLNKIDTGLSKAIEVMGELDRTCKDVIPQLMYYQQLKTSGQRDSAKLAPLYDPRAEIQYTLLAIQEMKSILGRPSKLPIRFTNELIDLWSREVQELDLKKLPHNYTSKPDNNIEAFKRVATLVLTRIDYETSGLKYLLTKAITRRNT